MLKYVKCQILLYDINQSFKNEQNPVICSQAVFEKPTVIYFGGRPDTNNGQKRADRRQTAMDKLLDFIT